MQAKIAANATHSYVLAWMMLCFVALGFGLNALLLPEKLPPSSSLLVIHALFTATWYVLLIIQVGLLRKNRRRSHKLFGWLSLLWALTIVCSGVGLTILRFLRLQHENDAALILLFNLANIVTFAILYVAGIANRKRIEYHYRFVLFASIGLLPPALARIGDALNINAGFALLLLLLPVALIVSNDHYRTGTLHSATKIGTLTLLGLLIFAFAVGGTLTWERLLLQLVH